MNEKTHLDLFSGIAGFALAAQWAGFRTIGFCECDPYCQAILKARFGAMEDAKSERCDQAGAEQSAASNRPRLHRDIRDLDGTDYAGVDLITGGFPCQPFSLAGKRTGKADDRHLWPEMRRVIAEARPRWVLAENVPGIIGMELDTVLSDLESEGYAAGTLVIPACAVDAPHRRDRVWIVAHAASPGLQHDSQVQTGAEQPGRDIPCGGCQPASNPILPRLEEQQRQPSDDGEKRETVERDGDGWCRWEPQSRLGGTTDGLSPLVDRFRYYDRWWGPGWEENVPRVARSIVNRINRLRAIGNAIVPQVAYQIIRHMQ